MLAVLAIVAFILATINVTIADLNMVALGLVFFAAHVLFPWIPSVGGSWRSPNRP